MEGSVNVRGMEELRKTLHELEVAVRGEIAEEALLAGGQVIAGAARQKIAKASGATAGQITARKTQDGTVEAGVIGDRAHVARFLEFGTRMPEGEFRQKPQPWLRPAAEESRDAALAAAARTLHDELEKRSK